MKSYAVFLLILLSAGCEPPPSRSISAASFPDLEKKSLGQTGYTLRIPSSMHIEETFGKEGQQGFAILNNDISRMIQESSGFIETEPGNPIGGRRYEEKPLEYVSSTLLSKTITWTIYKTETGRFGAWCRQGRLTLEASAPDASGVDSMIAVLATLSQTKE